jgi:hypothetical protein
MLLNRMYKINSSNIKMPQIKKLEKTWTHRGLQKQESKTKETKQRDIWNKQENTR